MFKEDNFNKAVTEWRDKGLDIVGKEAIDNVSGKVLNVKSGALLKDVQQNQQTEGPAAFSIGTSLPYGKAWENGFRRRAYTVRPRQARALKIPISGEEFIFRLRADIPSQTFAPKPFLKPAVHNNRNTLTKILGAAIGAAKIFTLTTVEVKINV